MGCGHNTYGKAGHWIFDRNVRDIIEQNLAELKTIPDIKHWLELHDENIGENMAE